MEAGGVVNYPPMGSPTGPLSSSTKVVNLSRAHITLGQQSPGTGQHTFYAQPAQSPTVGLQTSGSPGTYPAPQSPQAYQTTQRVNTAQPQVYTVGASQLMGQQVHYQPPQQFRVITTPQQPVVMDQNRPDPYAASQPITYSVQPNVIYFGQQTSPQPAGPQTQQYSVYSQQPQFAQPNQQTMRQGYQQPMKQDYQQPPGQVVFAQPAVLRPTHPPLQNETVQPVAFQSQTAMRSGPSGSVIVAANQPSPAQGQPISFQSSQQWVTPESRTTLDQAPHTQSQRQFNSAGQSKITSPPPTSLTQFGHSYTGAQQTSTGQLPQKTISFVQQSGQGYSQFTNQPRAVAQENAVTRGPGYQVYSQTPQQVRTPVPTDSDTVRRRAPSASGAARTFKVRSLPMRGSASVDALDKAVGPPQFVQQPPGQLTVNEGEPITVSTCVRPAGDSTLTVEWFKNGKPLSASSRFSTVFDRGYAVLEFIYANEEDSGDYSCVASNSCGQDQSTGCRITVIPEENVVTETQLPDESMVANLAAMENQLMQNGLARSARYRDEPKATRPPQFVKPLNPQVGIRELAPAHFETVIEPASDPSLTVEWYKDGKPVSMGCRFNAVMDRGFAILDILYCYPEDNGAYWCIAKNALGQAQSNVVDLQCTAEASIVTNSVLSKDSVSYLQSLDNWGSEQMAGYDRQTIDEEESPSAPVFDVLPQPLTVTEGTPAKFMVKASGFPRPKFQWFIDGELLASHGGGGNWHVYQDGGISYLEFHRVGAPCQQHIRAVARNNLGEVSADTVLVIEPQLDFRPDLRHVQPENPFKKLAQLKKVERTNELATAFSRPKPQAMDLRRIERQSEHKARTAAEAESIEAENLYSRVQAQLRTSRRSSLPPPAQSRAKPQQQQPIPAQPQINRTTTQQMQYAPPKPPTTPIQTQVKIMPQAPPAPPPAPQAPPPPPPPVQPQVQSQPPPPPPPISPPQMMANQFGAVPTHQAQTEYMHDEVSADFTIEL